MSLKEKAAANSAHKNRAKTLANRGFGLFRRSSYFLIWQLKSKSNYKIQKKYSLYFIQ